MKAGSFIYQNFTLNSTMLLSVELFLSLLKISQLDSRFSTSLESSLLTKFQNCSFHCFTQISLFP